MQLLLSHIEGRDQQLERQQISLPPVLRLRGSTAVWHEYENAPKGFLNVLFLRPTFLGQSD
jgi:hypothetical protein